MSIKMQETMQNDCNFAQTTSNILVDQNKLCHTQSTLSFKKKLTTKTRFSDIFVILGGCGRSRVDFTKIKS